MKNIAFILLGILGFSCIKSNNETHKIIDALKETAPLIRPTVAFLLTKEECDSIQEERKRRLDKYAEAAKSIKNETASLDFFLAKLAEERRESIAEELAAFEKKSMTNIIIL